MNVFYKNRKINIQPLCRFIVLLFIIFKLADDKLLQNSKVSLLDFLILN